MLFASQTSAARLQFHGQDGLGDAPLVHPALESISNSPLQGFAALKLVEVSMLEGTLSLSQKVVGGQNLVII